MKVTLAQLQVFVALCDTLHFTRASEQLGISQPTVSKEIRALERRLGVQLLARSSGGTTLTPAGNALQAHARSVLAETQLLEAAAETERRTSRHQVTIAASPSIVNRLLPETLRTVDDQQLGVTVRALEVETGEVVDAVDSGRADIGIGHHLGEPTRATKRRLGHDELQVLISRSLVPRDSTTADMKRLNNIPLLIWPRDRNPVYYDAMVDACRDRGLEPLRLTGTTRISGSWSYFLDDARAFALAPRDYAAHEARGTLISLSMDPPAFIPLEVIWRAKGSSDVEEILAILWELTRNRRNPPDHQPREAM